MTTHPLTSDTIATLQLFLPLLKDKKLSTLENAAAKNLERALEDNKTFPMMNTYFNMLFKLLTEDEQKVIINIEQLTPTKLKETKTMATSTLKDLKFKAQSLVNKLNERYNLTVTIEDYATGHKGRIATWENALEKLQEHEQSLVELVKKGYEEKLEAALAKVAEVDAIEQFQGESVSVEEVATPDEELIAAFALKISKPTQAQYKVSKGFQKNTLLMPRHISRKGNRFISSLSVA